MHGVQRKKFHRFVERPMGILRHLFIISITVGGGRLRGGRNTFVEAHVCTPFFRVCNLSSFHEKEKEMSVFSSSLVTCAPELCMPPLTSNMLFEYISGPVIQPVYALHPPPLFIATRLSNPRKRSWIIISRLSTRERYGENLSRLRNFHRSTSLCWRRKSRSFVLI